MLTPSPPEADALALTPQDEELVRGTYQVMARVGAQQLSLRPLGKDLGVSAALLVYRFGSKEKLLLTTMQWALLGMVERIRERLADIDDPQEALTALVDALFDDPRANRDFYLVYLDLVQYSIRDLSFKGLADLLWKYVRGSYAVVIQHGVASGVFDIEDIELAARQCRAIVEGSFLQWLQEDDWEATHATLREECRQMLIAVLSGCFGAKSATLPAARATATASA